MKVFIVTFCLINSGIWTGAVGLGLFRFSVAVPFLIAGSVCLRFWFEERGEP